MRKSYDYIIVGASPSGCVLANRLSENPACSVLLLEQGPKDRSMFISMPMGLAKLLNPGSPYMSLYPAVPAQGREPEYWIKGRTLGGSSSINGMVYTRGAPLDFDDWEMNGCAGWSWKEMSRCFQAIEGHELGASTDRGGDGPLKISLSLGDDPVFLAAIESAKAMGIRIYDDINSPEAVSSGGFGLQPRNIYHGRRCSAAKAFLKPVLSRKNLDVVTSAEVSLVEFEGTHCKGVKIRHKGNEVSVRANCDVLLCAGGIASPCLLQRSGVGDGVHLDSLGITPVVDLPGVGKNLSDHRTLPIQFRIKKGGSNPGLQFPGLIGSVLKYFLLGRGPLARSTFVAGGFVKTDPELMRPDVQIGIGPFTSGGSGPSSYPAITLYGYTLRPESRGSITITSKDPAAPPAINANYMATPYDRTNAITLLRLLRKLASQSALSEHIVEEIVPGVNVESDDDLLEHTFVHGTTGFHPAGGCSMGVNPGSVVDPQLKVHGVTGLRVVDLSIAPSPISGNTNGPAMAIGWRAADIILRGEESKV